jgi:transposase InsO family protein
MFKDFKSYAENETGKRVKAIRTENGSEYVNNAFPNFLKENDIRRQLTVEYNPEMNGVAKRANRTIVEKARTVLQETSLKPSYWAEDVNTTVYLMNRSPTKALKGMVPEEAWTGRTVSLRHLRVFGSRAFAHIPK